MTPPAETADIRSLIRDVPDFPKKGIVFKDITPLLSSPEGFRRIVDLFVERFEPLGVKKVAGIESRGFLLASAVADRLGAGVVLVRKKGKLPWRTVRQEFQLEYGTDAIEVHEDALGEGERVLLLDDVLATGGTAEAACALLEKVGGEVAGLGFLIELGFLKGRDKLDGRKIDSLIVY